MAKKDVKKCPKCSEEMVNEALEWKCFKCGYTICIEPEYCPAEQSNKEE